jgi:hypothetical protein
MIEKAIPTKSKIYYTLAGFTIIPLIAMLTMMSMNDTTHSITPLASVVGPEFYLYECQHIPLVSMQPYRNNR